MKYSSLSSAGDETSIPCRKEDDKQDYTYYVPAHSDFLIHWTGLDIDKKYDSEWYNEPSSATASNVTRLYLERLKGILKHGLWMTDDNEEITINGRNYPRPKHCRTCFTELKLSSVRGHAKSYGRLGIGFKRFYVFNRMGQPMVYYHEMRPNWFAPAYWNVPQNSFTEFFGCFLKPMTTRPSGETRTLVYSLYDESEWRIIYSNEIRNFYDKTGLSKNYKDLGSIMPEDRFSDEIKAFIKSQNSATNSSVQPKAVIPVNDEWFTMIIYPSLAAKVEAEADAEIRRLICDIKPEISSRPSYEVQNPYQFEKNSKPIELDLDACRQF